MAPTCWTHPRNKEYDDIHWEIFVSEANTSHKSWSRINIFDFIWLQWIILEVILDSNSLNVEEQLERIFFYN